ncbi:hypothetical protein CesoFtcFv8_012605 [Champsocephalus esox]|uniref:Uncharacterized protein n=1 Tax=Champsocephalus esox TaxID=159716 RepID=A0AAN8BXQ5_9TELE|nr:hypothetical protein CesoFtcFv8_012605 [Champsocephalus esox]
MASELGVEQKADVSLGRFFEAVLSTEDGESAAGGYLLQGELLVRKWLPHGEDFIDNMDIRKKMSKKKVTLESAGHP